MSPTVVAATVAVGGAGAVVRAVGGRRRQVRMAAVARNCDSIRGTIQVYDTEASVLKGPTTITLFQFTHKDSLLGPALRDLELVSEQKNLPPPRPPGVSFKQLYSVLIL